MYIYEGLTVQYVVIYMRGGRKTQGLSRVVQTLAMPLCTNDADGMYHRYFHDHLNCA